MASAKDADSLAKAKAPNQTFQPKSNTTVLLNFFFATTHSSRAENIFGLLLLKKVDEFFFLHYIYICVIYRFICAICVKSQNNQTTIMYSNNPQQLFTDFQARNEKAIRYVYNTILPYIKNLAKCYPHLRNETTAIADDTIMTCLKRIDEDKFVYQATGNMMGFMFKTAQYEVKSAARLLKNRTFCNIEAVDNETTTFHYQPNWENRDIVTNILRQLPKEHRKLFLLRMKGYEYSEIADNQWLNFSNAACMKTIFNKDKGKLGGLGQFLG